MPIVHELAVQVARTPSGVMKTWPVVETVQVNGICVEVVAPAPRISPPLAAQAETSRSRLPTRWGWIRRIGRHAESVVLAGTVARGDSPEADAALERELLESAKKAVEHKWAAESVRERRYACPVGWVDAHGDGEFAIVLRRAQVSGATARLWAGRHPRGLRTRQ